MRTRLVAPAYACNFGAVFWRMQSVHSWWYHLRASLFQMSTVNSVDRMLASLPPTPYLPATRLVLSSW